MQGHGMFRLEFCSTSGHAERGERTYVKSVEKHRAHRKLSITEGELLINPHMVMMGKSVMLTGNWFILDF